MESSAENMNPKREMKRAQNMHWLKNQVDDVMLPCVASALNRPKPETVSAPLLTQQL